ncbi:hypothetical protein KJ359_004238 [Pestalotiopsis sp. 9143b]|nr:hypothetical protein KJ359_004238 [Pestalotiopsis sp. 9143b]
MELKYRDGDMPIDLTGLEKNLHLDWKVRRRWTEQYIYYLNYKSIVFDDGIDKEQHIDADARLPYVKDLESHDGGYGTVRCYEMAPEYIELGAKGQRVVPAELAGHLLEQSEAIVQALRFLHEGFVVGRETMACAHMDLKPDNIIIFEGGKVGTWKICDFGISVVRKKPSAGSQDQQSGQGDVVSLGDYYSKSIETYPKRPASDFQPPEVRDTGSATSPAKVGRRIDIWSFGAILAEILAFCMDTDKGVPSFREQRRDRVFGYENGLFYSPDTTASNSNYLSASTVQEPAVDLQLRPQVRQWLDNISTSFSSQGPWIAMWIECIQKTLVISFKMRPKAIVLLKLIRGILAQLPSDGEDDNSSSEGSDSGPSNGGSDPGRTTPPKTPTPRIGINIPVHAEEESIRDNGGNATQVSEIVPESDISEIGSNMPPSTDARVTEESSITTIAELRRSRTIGEGKYDSSESSKSLGLKSESVIAIAIDDPRIVYLTMKWVKVYRIKTFGGFEVSEEESIPQQENQECRRHIAIAGDFMVLWRKLDTIAQVSQCPQTTVVLDNN